MRDGVHPFLPPDFFLDKSSKEPERLVLVGGQALEVWGVVLNVAPPTARTVQGKLHHALTVDTDWLGGKDDAQWLAELLGVERTELCVPDAADPTPNTALLDLGRDNRILLMDFLASITGLENREIAKPALDVDFPSEDGKQLILRVLDPVHCLQSRMSNLMKMYQVKRDGNGPAQAKWAVDIVHAFLRYLVTEGAMPKTIRVYCHRVAEVAEYGAKAAEFCFTQYGVDPLAAVSDDVVNAGGEKFAAVDCPVTLERIRGKQSHWGNKQRDRFSDG